MCQILFQESEKGAWHVPIAGDSNEESERTWLCITRPSVYKALDEVLPNADSNLIRDNFGLRPCTSGSFVNGNNLHGDVDSSETSDSKTGVVTGKRKERSFSTS